MRVRITEEGVIEEVREYAVNNIKLLLNIEIDLKIKNKTRAWKTDKQVVNIVLMNMLRCADKNCRLHYSRQNNTKAKTIYNKRGIRNFQIIKAVEFLESMNYLTNHIAPRQYSKSEDKMSSWIQPSPFFLSEFMTDTELLIKANSAFNAAWMPIIMKNGEKEPIDYRADEYSFAIERVLNRLNTVNSGFTFIDHEGKEFQNWYCRIFNNSNFMEGGRFYKASVLNIENKESKNRLHIKINGEDVVEVDYTALHIFMVAERLGCADKYGDDPYALVPDINRNVVKLAVNIMFNCTSRLQATRSVNNKLQELGYKEHSGSAIVTAIFKAFPELKDEFCYKQCTGLKLQNHDSWMTHYVANVMSTLGKPFLPVHDSGIVRKQDEQLLISLMCDAYKETLKVDSIVHMKVNSFVNGELVKDDVSC